MSTTNDSINFGTRFLESSKCIYEHNAWDNVDFPEEKNEEIKLIIKKQKDSPVLPEKSSELKSRQTDEWNNFYTKHSNNFFMDRNWIIREIPELLTIQPTPPNEFINILDVGCGVGNTTFPILETRKEMFVNSCDFSEQAIQTLKMNRDYDPHRCNAFIWDITQPTNMIKPETMDVVLCIYVLSAVPPEKHLQAISNLASFLKPGGIFFIKDYGLHDLTQLRFKSERFISENLYCRGDGTLVNFFTIEQIDKLVYQAGLNKKKLLLLSCETAKKKGLFKQFVRKTNLPFYECDFNLLAIFLYEFIYGRGIEVNVKSSDKQLYKIWKLVRDNIQQIKNEISELEKETNTNSESSGKLLLPRYARINTIKNSFDEVTENLKQKGWDLIRLETKCTDEQYFQRIRKQKTNQILIDPHLNDLLIFPPNADLHELDLVVNGSLILQDKASCLPVFVLCPEPGSIAIDACAAPGMKTTHLAAAMNNKGEIWAFDRNTQRFSDLKQMLKKTGVKIVRAENKDFLKVNFKDKRFFKVEYAVVDPPCSGSGMVKRNEISDNLEDNEIDKRRIQSLSNLQAMILKHALKLPNLKRLVYSTCSTSIEENEGVILEVIKDVEISSKFALVDPLPNWEHRGINTGEYENIGNKCLRSSFEHNLTNGFFVALFQRL